MVEVTDGRQKCPNTPHAQQRLKQGMIVLGHRGDPAVVVVVAGSDGGVGGCRGSRWWLARKVVEWR